MTMRGKKEKSVYRIDDLDALNEAQCRILDYKASPNKMYVPIDNSLIYYSCSVNPYVLPITLYSWVHAQHGFNRYVETSISMIQQTIAQNKVPSRVYGIIKDSLDFLWGGTDDEYFQFGDMEWACPSPQLRFKAYYLNIKPSTILRYYSDVGLREQQGHVHGYTVVTADEYYYILESVNRWNDYHSFEDPRSEEEDILVVNCAEEKIDEDASSTLKPLDFCTLLNLYVYLKTQISHFDSIRRLSAGNCIFYMRESVQTISKKMGKGNRTISYYINILIDLGLIGINGKPNSRESGKFIPNVPTRYWLSDVWINYINERGYNYAF